LGVNDERTKVSIVALTELSNTTDLATHIEPEDDWVRRSLCTLASTGATNEAPSAQRALGLRKLAPWSRETSTG
jgi:hypothetical protein